MTLHMGSLSSGLRVFWLGFCNWASGLDVGTRVWGLGFQALILQKPQVASC